MIIEMLVSKISKDGNFDRDAESAKFGEGVGGDFENQKLGATFFNFGDTLI